MGHGTRCRRRHPPCERSGHATVNSKIRFWEESNAGDAVKALMDSLALKAKVKRNGQWNDFESASLVPGDMVSKFYLDCRLREAVNVSIDQAPLTGESASGEGSERQVLLLSIQH
jgi:magnesium-transporting ATPase (P-type)